MFMVLCFFFFCRDSFTKGLTGIEGFNTHVPVYKVAASWKSRKGMYVWSSIKSASTQLPSERKPRISQPQLLRKLNYHSHYCEKSIVILRWYASQFAWFDFGPYLPCLQILCAELFSEANCTDVLVSGQPIRSFWWYAPSVCKHLNISARIGSRNSIDINISEWSRNKQHWRVVVRNSPVQIDGDFLGHGLLNHLLSVMALCDRSMWPTGFTSNMLAHGLRTNQHADTRTSENLCFNQVTYRADMWSSECCSMHFWMYFVKLGNNHLLCVWHMNMMFAFFGR
jgi:hypothetical protein